jgi:hypothetical protein
LKLKCDEPLSNFAFNFNLRRYTEGSWDIFDKMISDFNATRQAIIDGSDTLVYDELMCAWRPRTTALGGLPNLSYVFRKPEPLGTESRRRTWRTR